MREAPGSEIRRKASERHIPLNVAFELTYRCNLSCVHCYLEEDTAGELTTEEVFSIIDQLAEAGTLEITFTGGEPLVRDDFFDIAGYARERGMAIILMSNGTLIDEKAVERMKQFHFFHTIISLYGVTPETHEKVTTLAGSFSKTLKAIKFLRQSGFKVQINTPVMKQNVNEIAKIDDFCIVTGAELNASPLLSPTTSGSMKPLKYRLSDGELKRYMRWEVGSGKRVGGLIQTCVAGVCTMNISAHGKVFPCNSLRLEAGDLRQESLDKIWSSSPLLQWIRDIKIEDFIECSRCELLDTCTRCPGQALSEEGDIFAPCKESCRISRVREEVKNEQENCGWKGKEKVYEARTNQA